MRNLESAVGKIYRTDALAFMRDLPDESFDLVVCDGPYAVTTHAWDNVPDIQHFNLELLKSFSRLEQPRDRKSTRLNSSHLRLSRMPSSA